MTCPHIYGGAVLMWRSPHMSCSYFKLVYASFRDLPQILWELGAAYIMYINSSKAPHSLVYAGPASLILAEAATMPETECIPFSPMMLCSGDINYLLK
jgi:hypothetical protein